MSRLHILCHSANNPLEVLEAAEVLGNDIDIHVDDKNDKNVESERNLGKMSLLSKARRKEALLKLCAQLAEPMNLEEALEISDRITVLRDGQHVLTEPVESLDQDAIVKAMVGRELSKELYGGIDGDRHRGHRRECSTERCCASRLGYRNIVDRQGNIGYRSRLVIVDDRDHGLLCAGFVSIRDSGDVDNHCFIVIIHRVLHGSDGY